MKARILVIEDDPDVQLLVRYNLEREGFSVIASETGRDALPLCLAERPDLVLLDIMLPDSDGIEICRQIRAHSQLGELPIIFLSAKAEETDRVVGLEVGGNDYLVKPFFVRELIARIRKQLLRPPSRAAANRQQATCGLEIDHDGRRARMNGRSVDLSDTEFRLLDFLSGHPGVVFSRQQLLSEVWAHSKDVTERSVDVYILRLRQKLDGCCGDEPCIRSVRGLGYRYDPIPGNGH